MVLVIGEALMDLMTASNDSRNIESRPGGAGFNVACALGNLEVVISYAYPISNDAMGDILFDQLTQCGVKYALGVRNELSTPLAIVSMDQNGQPDYRFYRQGTVDGSLSEYNFHKLLNSQIHIVHFTGFTLNEANDFEVWLELAKKAKSLGCLISLDPNVRPFLISNPSQYNKQMWRLIELADIVKVSVEDLAFLSPELSSEKGLEKISNNATLAVLTLGTKGCDVKFRHELIHFDTILDKNFVDSVGAGDCFSAGYIKKMTELGINTTKSLQKINEEQLTQIFNFASLCASLNCARKGCQPPSLNELMRH